MDVDFDLEEDMSKDEGIISLLRHREIACEFYAALCNMKWVRIVEIPEDQQIIDKLKGENRKEWSCTWRYAGGIIADIRNTAYNVHENYLDFYCSGNEGHVSPTVKRQFERLGWAPEEW